MRAALLFAIRTTDDDIVLDCSEMTFIDSSGIRVLIEAKKVLDAQRRGRHFRIVDLTANPKHTIDAVRFTEVLHIADNL